MMAKRCHWPPKVETGYKGRPSYLYFIQTLCGTWMKIGVTTAPEKRTKELCRVSPVPLAVVSIIENCNEAVEWAVHEHFMAEWSHAEWFTISDRLRHFVMDVETYEDILEIVPAPLFPFGRVYDSCGNLLLHDDARAWLRDRARGEA